MVVKRIQESDIEILKGLYELRVMSTDQIRKRYNLTEWYAYKKIARLRNTGWIITEPISGYKNKQRSQGVYHRISEIGISCLRKQGITIVRKAHHQLPTKRHLPYVLLTNDLIIDLEPFDWTFKDSRTLKNEYQLNRGDSLQAMLRDPDGKEFLIYMLRESVTEPTLVKIQKEIESYSAINPMDKQRLTNNYMIFVQGQHSYQQVVDRFSHYKDAMLTSRHLKLFPLSFAKKYLRAFYNNAKFIDFIKQKEIVDVTEERLPLVRKQYKGLSNIVLHEEEEKYLVNLLDSDLVSIYNINQYRKEQYQLDGRKVLAITTNSLAAEHRKMLQGIKHIEFYSIKHQEIFDYIENRKRVLVEDSNERRFK
ncbi:MULTISPECIES: replication-relaxation family protein [Oceanobacillus]|uniref:replication-relaxation family protein n=1 Tax=Oceanobacillus TaxID=182709 RepID=UPI000595875D|nr:MULTISPECIES: replication-relaxation family protein [Oceanobacillus]